MTTTIDVTAHIDPTAAGQVAATIYDLPGVCSILSKSAVIDYVAGHRGTATGEADASVEIVVDVWPQCVEDLAEQSADLPAVNTVEYNQSLLQATE